MQDVMVWIKSAKAYCTRDKVFKKKTIERKSRVDEKKN